MSADNYLALRGHNGKYVVTMEFMSADEMSDLDNLPERRRPQTFDTYREAERYLEAQYEAANNGTGGFIEYGPFIEQPSPWDDDKIQFPRLLAEIYATQDSLKMADLCASMDIEVGDIVEIFERAQAEWERIKEAMT